MLTTPHTGLDACHTGCSSCSCSAGSAVSWWRQILMPGALPTAPDGQTTNARLRATFASRFRDGGAEREHAPVPPLPSTLTLAMPAWFEEAALALPDHVPTVEARMAVVNALARRNVDERTGGPFAAGVFERASGRLVSLGVNRVVDETCSCAHAETMALALAQGALGTWDLGAPGLPAHQLVVNWRPCAMCFGAALWSGVVELVIAGEGAV